MIKVHYYIIIIFFPFQTNGMEQLRIEEELHRHRAPRAPLDKHYAHDDSRVHMYELATPSDPTANRLSAPECGLKKVPLSNSLSDLCEGMHVHAAWVE